MHCLVTAGPTYESLDQVRRLTNFSTGKLGSELARTLDALGHKVTLLLGDQATWPGPFGGAVVKRFSTTENLLERFKEASTEGVDAVFHAAAVSDFTFGKVYEKDEAGALVEVRGGKLSTRRGGLFAELVPTPKLISQLRTLFPAAFLVGWKYEVDGGREVAFSRAVQQLRDNGTDACVLNGPAYGDGFGWILGADAAAPRHLSDSQALLEFLGGEVKRRARG